MNTCQIVTKVISGEDALSFLKTYEHERILIVCDTFLNKNGTIKLVTDQIAPSNQTVVFDRLVPDPTLDVVADGVKEAIQLQATIIIGFGGGAAIDTAKGIVYFAMGGKALQAKPTFAVIPTTSGTGSEMTAFAVITDTAEKRKIALIDDLMYADVALLDPHLTLSVPASVTANTGFDVLTHAIEAYVSKTATDFTDAVACQAVSMTIANLPKCYHYGGNLKAREKMSNASNMAGIAFNIGGLGMVHSMAHQLGGMFHIPHGLACALCLTTGIIYNSQDPSVEAKYADLAYRVGIVPRTAAASTAVQALCAVIQAFMNDMAMPTRIWELKQAVSRSDYEAVIPQMAANAMEDRCLPGNPVAVTQETFEKLFNALY